MAAPESNSLINLEEDKKAKKRTSPQITPELYAKWLTDKYNDTVKKGQSTIDNLCSIIKKLEEENKQLRKAADSKRLKYMNDQGEFSRELMKDATIQKYTREIGNLHKAIIRLRRDNGNLIAENNKLKNK